MTPGGKEDIAGDGDHTHYKIISDFLLLKNGVLQQFYKLCAYLRG